MANDTTTISKDMKVKIPLHMLLGLLVATVGGVQGYNQITARQEQTIRMIEQLKNSAWSVRQQEKYSRQLERDNPALRVPDPFECCGDNRRAEAIRVSPQNSKTALAKEITKEN